MPTNPDHDFGKQGMGNFSPCSVFVGGREIPWSIISPLYGVGVGWYPHDAPRPNYTILGSPVEEPQV